ncbi:hypothetical protein DDD63_11860 [Actinobaculum sp. 313]|nr:hypothetical protein DDD63_11860 [Actinobaculum sp. 313]
MRISSDGFFANSSFGRDLDRWRQVVGHWAGMSKRSDCALRPILNPGLGIRPGCVRIQDG